MVTISKVFSSKGKYSAFACTYSIFCTKPLSRNLSRPTFNIELLISANTTLPSRPTSLENLAVKSPVPPARSNTLLPGRTPLASIVKRFHKR